MIAKISTGTNIHGLLSYNETKVSDGEATIIYGNNIIGNFDDNYESISIKDKIDSFMIQLDENKRTENLTFHVSLNPDPDDEVTEEIYREMAQEYMEKMGFGDQPYLVYHHNDLDRSHIHIVSIRVDASGRSISNSFERYRSHQITKDLEDKYNLIPADVQRQNEQQRKKKEDKNININDLKVIPNLNPERRNDLSGQLKRAINYSLKFNLTSFEQFNLILGVMNVGAEIVKDKETGAVRGLIYFVTDKNGVRTSQGLKSSKLGQSYGLTALDAKFGKQKSAIKDRASKQYENYHHSKKSIQKRLDAILRRFETLTVHDFTLLCEKESIRVKFSINDSGRIYGVTFVDLLSKKVWKGSELGKKYSANQLSEFIKVEHKTSIEKKDQKELLGQVATIYAVLRKESIGRYYYESLFIQDYAELFQRLSESLRLKNPELSPLLADYTVRKYITYKQSKLSDIRDKEFTHFTQLAKTMYGYAWRLDQDSRQLFLAKNGLKAEMDIQTGKVRLVDIKNTNYYLVMDDLYLATIWKEKQVSARSFNKEVRQLIQAIEEGKGVDYIESLNFKTFNKNQEFLKFIPGAYNDAILEKMHTDSINVFLSEVKDLSDEEFVKRALASGWIISIENGQPFLRHYTYPAGAPEKIEGRSKLEHYIGDVNKAVYTKNDKVSSRYRLFVLLSQLGDKDTEKALRSAQRYLSKNPLLLAEVSSCTSVEEMTKVLMNQDVISGESINRLSKEDYKSINDLLFLEYSALRKQDPFGKFDSLFIEKSLPGYRDKLAGYIANNFPQLSQAQIDAAVDGYISYKTEKKSDIREQEQGRFKDATIDLVKYALSLDKNLRNQFLSKCGIQIAVNSTGNLVCQSKDSNHLSFVTSLKNSDIPFVSDQRSGFDFNYQQVRFFKSIISGEQPDTSLLEFKNFYPNAEIFTFIKSESLKSEVLDQMYLSSVRNFLSNKKDIAADELVRMALENGFMFTKSGDSYLIKHIDYAGKTRLRLAPEFTEILNAISYSKREVEIQKFIYGQEDKVSSRYRVFAKLTKALNTGDLAKANQAIEYLEKYNSKLYKELTCVKGSDNDKIREMITIIASYDNPKLLEVSKRSRSIIDDLFKIKKTKLRDYRTKKHY